MLLLLPVLVLLTLLPAATAWGQECIILQSSPLRPYEEARLGFEQAWAAQRPLSGPKSITSGTVTPILLSAQPEENTKSLKKQVENARLVVVIGDPALNFVRDLHQTPVLYLLAPSAGKLPANFTGIDLRIPPSRQIAAMGRLMPGLRRIGALYNPAESGPWVQEALSSPADSVDTLLFKKIDVIARVPGALHSLAGNTIDAYWLLPDELVTNPQVMAQLREFSMTNRVPVIAFSEKYLASGAAVAVTFDMADMGSQAAEMAARILAGTDPAAIPVETPRRERIIVNTGLLQRLEAPFNEAAADELYPGDARP